MLGQTKLSETISIAESRINQLKKRLKELKKKREKHVGKGKTILWDGRGKQASKAYTRQHFRGNLPGACQRGKYTEEAWSIPFKKTGHRKITVKMTLHENANGGNRCSIGRFRIGDIKSRCMKGGVRHGSGHYTFRRSDTIDISGLPNKKYNIIIEWAAIKTGCCDSGYVRGPSDPMVFYYPADLVKIYDRKIKKAQSEFSDLKKELASLKKIKIKRFRKKEEVKEAEGKIKKEGKKIEKIKKEVKKAGFVPSISNLKSAILIVGLLSFIIARRR